MNLNDRLYVEIVPFEGPRSPVPHPIRDARFDPDWVYKVLGMYNASETSECYFVLANPQREIWFIPQRHLRAWGLYDSDELFLEKRELVDKGLSSNKASPADRITFLNRAFNAFLKDRGLDGGPGGPRKSAI